jgi:hypothetical protein
MRLLLQHAVVGRLWPLRGCRKTVVGARLCSYIPARRMPPEIGGGRLTSGAIGACVPLEVEEAPCALLKIEKASHAPRAADVPTTPCHSTRAASLPLTTIAWHGRRTSSLRLCLVELPKSIVRLNDHLVHLNNV